MTKTSTTTITTTMQTLLNPLTYRETLIILAVTIPANNTKEKRTYAKS